MNGMGMSNRFIVIVYTGQTALDNGFHAVDFGFQVLDSSIFQWNLCSGFQSFNGIDRGQKPQETVARALVRMSCGFCPLSIPLNDWNPESKFH